MLTYRFSVALFYALIAGLGFARAEDRPPLQDPQLRIEAGMHTARIRRLDTSVDGKLLVTGSDDKTVRLWSMPEGKLIKTLRVPVGPDNEGKVFAVAISPDGRVVAAGGSDTNDKQHVYLFDTVSGALTMRLSEVPGAIWDLAFSSDGKLLVAGVEGAGIRVWHSPFTDAPSKDVDFRADVYGISFDRSGSGRFAITSTDGMIRLYDRHVSLPPKMVAAPGGDYPIGIDFSPDGKTIAVGYDDTTNIDIVSVPELVRIHQVDTAFADNGDLSKVAWSADGQILYAGGRYLNIDAALYPVIRWPDAGHGNPLAAHGKPLPLGHARNTVSDLAPLPHGDIAYSSGDPAFGLVDPHGRSKLLRGPVSADMRGKLSDHFWIAPDSSGVWFGLQFSSEEPWRLDMAQLTFEADETRPPEYIQPETATLKIENWVNTLQPTLNGRVLPLKPSERSRSLAIAPEAKSFAIGTEWSIYRFDAKGEQLWRIPVPGTVWGVNFSVDGSIIVAAQGDGTIRWYRASDGAELLAFFVHVPDKRWIAWTPSGYYAASPGGEDLIGWHVNGKTWDEPVNFFSASLFRSRFYRPDIVQLVLRTKDEARAIEQANIIAKRKSEEVGIDKTLPPVVEIIADPRGSEAKAASFELRYRLRSPSGRALTRLELRVDGQLTQPRAMETVDESLLLDTDLVMTVPLPPRDVIVSLTAFIEDQASEVAHISVRWTGRSEQGPKPRLYALLVGVSEYDEPKLKLNYAAKDAKDVDAMLQSQKGRFFENVETVILLDRDATEDRIEIELSRLRKKVGKDDYALVFMAGHGVTDAQGGFHFLPANASLAEDELAATSLNGLIIRDNLRTMQGKVLLFMDACHAGSGADQALADMTGFANEFVQSNGVVMYASSTGRQFSYENSQWQNGAFTHALVSVFGDAAAYGRDGLLSISELDEELTTRVQTLTGGLQTPVMTKSAAIPRFFVAALQ